MSGKSRKTNCAKSTNYEELLDIHKQFMSDSFQSLKNELTYKFDNFIAKFSDELEQVTRSIEFTHEEIIIVICVCAYIFKELTA